MLRGVSLSGDVASPLLESWHCLETSTGLGVFTAVDPAG